jgi:hypothetical protein
MELLMPENLTHFEFLVVAGGLIGFWLKHQSDFTTMKVRVKDVEGDNGELKKNIETLLKEIQEIKLLLAKNQMQ